MKEKLVNFRKDFDDKLDLFWQTQAHRFEAITKNKELIEFVMHAQKIAQGGKRVRPFLALLTSGKNWQDLSETEQGYLLAIELIHVFALIHDDIMDEADTRHHNPTVHNIVIQSLEKNERKGDLRFQGDMQAMIVGDLVFWLAGSFVVPDNKTKNSNFSEIRRFFTEVIEQVVFGQMLDFDTSSRMQISREELLEKTKNKTAYYTFIYPLLIGNQLNTSPEDDELLTSIGDALGLAYQIQDDLIDIIGTSPDKPHLQDVANGQHTLMSQHIFENGNPAQKKQLLDAWRKPVSKNEEAALLHLFKESGAIQSAKKEAAELFGSARSSIANLSCFNLKTQLIGLTELLEHREK